MISRTLAVCSSKDEAIQLLKFNLKNAIFIALSLEAEFFLKKKFNYWKNPLYSLINRDGYTSGVSYFLSNFKLTHNWYRNENYKFIHDRLGFFLMELDRSLDFAKKAIRKYQPKKIIIPPLSDYKSASVISGNLIPHAFFLCTKEKSIRVNFFEERVMKTGLASRIGKLIQSTRYIRKMHLQGSCDLLIIAPPRHLLQIANFVGTLNKNKIGYKILTYSVTYKYKKKFDRLFGQYLEKERLIDDQIIAQANHVHKVLIQDKEWILFDYPKYKRRKIIIDYIRNRIRQYVSEELGQIITEKLLADKILRSINPKLLLTITDPDTKALTFIDSAKKLKIQTLSFQHGADFTPIPYSLPVSDNYIVWSYISKKCFLANNYTNTQRHLPKNKILIGESPFHSFIQPSKSKLHRDELNVLFLATIHFFEQGLVSYYQKQLFESLADLSNLKLMVRTHDYQNTMNLKALVDEMGVNAYFANDRTLTSCLEEADVIIFESTTAGLDALLMGKPSIFFNPYDGNTFFKKNKGAFATILKSGEIKPKLKQILSDQKIHNNYALKGYKFAFNYLGVEKGNNYRRTVKIIKDYLN